MNGIIRDWARIDLKLLQSRYGTDVTALGFFPFGHEW